MFNTSQKTSKTLKLVKQALGTLQKVQSMIDQNNYCPEIIQQLDSVTGLIATARKELLEGHLEHCVKENWAKDSEKMIKELIKIYSIK